MERLEKIGLLVSAFGTLFNLTVLITGLVKNLEMWHIILRAVNFLVCFACFLYMLPIKINKK